MSVRFVSFAIFSLPLVGASALACKSPDSGDDGSSLTTETGDSLGDGDGDPGDGDPGDGDGDGPVCASALDILFIVDDTETMGEVQAKLASAAPQFLAALDGADVDWRIAVTSTDSGNPWCSPFANEPERGKFVMSSCMSRPNDFQIPDGIDEYGVACTDVCTLDDFYIEATPAFPNDSEAPRPWLEKVDGVTNLANGVDPAAALACALPMGASGCQFESPLFSLDLAIARMTGGVEPEYGFLRQDASLLVIIVSDGSECSYDPEWLTIWEQDGNKVFWSDPSAPSPTGAVCWNAGVECIGDPSGYDSCEPADKDVDGNPTAAEGDSVLFSLSRFYDRVDGIQSEKWSYDESLAVRVSLLGGVGLDGSLTYADSTDPSFQDAYGIGPGCSNGVTQAVPPVRTRDLAAHTNGDLRSICADEYASALTAMLEPFIAGCE